MALWESVGATMESVDGFPRTDRSHVRRTFSGGILSVAVFSLLALLTLGEVYHFVYPPFREIFVVDGSVGSHIDLDLDISVATECDKLIVFLADEMGRREMINDSLSMQDDTFESVLESGKQTDGELSAGMRQWMRAMRDARSEAVSGQPSPSLHSCRIRGRHPVSKTGGKLLIVPFLSFLGETGQALEAQDDTLNFSHYVEHFAFGPDYPRMRNPLNGSSQLVMKPREHFLYFLSIMTATYHDRLFGGHRVSTSQYALNGFLGRNGQRDAVNPGLFFTYSYEPLEKRILRDREPFIEFVTHLLGIVGGIYVSSSLLHRILTKGSVVVSGLLGWARRSSSVRCTTKSFDAGWSPVLTNDSDIGSILKSTTAADVGQGGQSLLP